MSRENLRNTWYCPIDGSRLSYGIYCTKCKVECSVAWRPGGEPARAALELLALAAKAWLIAKVLTDPAPDPPGHQPDEDGDGELFAEAAADQADQEADHG